jgi:hypothetical protein
MRACLKLHSMDEKLEVEINFLNKLYEIKNLKISARN